VTSMVAAQRQAYGVALPLYDLMLEDMSEKLAIGWGGATDKFDVTMCISTIEHVDAHDAAMCELVRITKPGGYIFITSDYFRDLAQWEASPSRHMQVTPYMKDFVLALPGRFGLEFIERQSTDDSMKNTCRHCGTYHDGTCRPDLDYCGDFVQTYSFVNICMRRLL